MAREVVMSSAFKLLSQSCGLSIAEAAEAVNLRHASAQSYWLDRRTCPPGVIRDLAALFAKIDKAAQREAKRIEAGAGEVVLTLPATDKEAQANGWPCIGAQAAVYRRVLESLPAAQLDRVKVVKG